MPDTTTLAPQTTGLRGARKYLESTGLIRQGMKLSGSDCYLDFHEENEVKLHSGAGVGMAQVAPFILGQKDIRGNVI